MATPRIIRGGALYRSENRRSASHKIATLRVQKAQEEADKLNSFRSLAKKTAVGVPKAIGDIVGQVRRAPLRTAGHVATGLYNDGLRPLVNMGLRPFDFAANVGQKNNLQLPKVNFEAKNQAEEGIQKGFGVGGEAGAFVAGNGVMRLALDAPKVASALSKVLPKFVMTKGDNPLLRPIATELVSDQVMTQGLLDKGTSWEDRAMNAALAPVTTGLLHGAGRGASIVKARVKDQLGDSLPKDISLGEMSGYDLSKFSRDDIIKHIRALRESRRGVHQDPETGRVQVEDAVKNSLRLADDEKKYRSPNRKKMGPIERSWSSTQSELDEVGPHGTTLGKLLHETKFTSAQNKAAFKGELDELLKLKAVKKWTQADMDRIVDALQNPRRSTELLHTPEEHQMFRLMDSIRRDWDRFARENQIKVTGPDGKPSVWDKQDPSAYYPHYVSDKGLTKAEFREQEIERLISSGEARTRYDADILFKAGQSQKLAHRSGHLEKSRSVNATNYDRDIRAVVARYLDETSNRKAEIELFGQDMSKLRPLLQRLAEDGFSGDRLQKVVDEMFGTPQENSRLIELALKFNQFTKLSLSPITNLTQNVNTMTVGGVRNTLESMWSFIANPSSRKSMRAMAEIADASDEVLMTTESNVSPGKLLKAALYFFQKAEKFNRTIAGDVGKKKARQSLAILLEDPTNKKAIRSLEYLGLDIKKLLSDGKIDPEDISRAAYNMVTHTQFRIDPLAVPLWARSPIGKLFTQFKSFGYMQTKFFRDGILSEAKEGNLVPLATYLAAAPAAFYFAKGFRNMVTLRDPQLRESLGLSVQEEDEDAANIERFDNILSMTGALPAQVTQSMLWVARNIEGAGLIDSTAMVAGNILGPTVSEGGNLVRGIVGADKVARENEKEADPRNVVDPYFQLKRQATNWVPYIGPGLRNTYFRDWPKREREVFRDELQKNILEALKIGDRAAIMEMRNAMKNMHEFDVFKDELSKARTELLPTDERERYESIRENKKDMRLIPFD